VCEREREIVNRPLLYAPSLELKLVKHPLEQLRRPTICQNESGTFGNNYAASLAIIARDRSSGRS
jgi:hypothetical protein